MIYIYTNATKKEPDFEFCAKDMGVSVRDEFTEVFLGKERIDTVYAWHLSLVRTLVQVLIYSDISFLDVASFLQGTEVENISLLGENVLLGSTALGARGVMSAALRQYEGAELQSIIDAHIHYINLITNSQPYLVIEYQYDQFNKPVKYSSLRASNLLLNSSIIPLLTMPVLNGFNGFDDIVQPYLESLLRQLVISLIVSLASLVEEKKFVPASQQILYDIYSFYLYVYIAQIFALVTEETIRGVTVNDINERLKRSIANVTSQIDHISSIVLSSAYPSIIETREEGKIKELTKDLFFNNIEV
jgi:hypothetical protein